MSTNEIPTDVTFTPADVEAGAKPQRLRAGWRQWLITGAERSVSKDNGYLMITLSTRALAVEGDPTSIKGPNVRNNIVLPLKNPSRDDHRPPNTAGICHATLRALYPDEIPDYPRRVNGKLTYLGQTIDAADEALAPAIRDVDGRNGNLEVVVTDTIMASMEKKSALAKTVLGALQ